MRHNMRGFIDPYTLGFLISLIGGIMVISTHEHTPFHESGENKQTEEVIQSNKIVDRVVVL